jgi:hypothetical protein
VTRYEQLKFALSVLASPANEQVQYLSSIGHFEDEPPPDSNCVSLYESQKYDYWNIDELSLQFSDIACARGDMKGNGEINDDQYNCISDLDEVLRQQSGEENAPFWTLIAMREDTRWEQVRQLAKECLLKF